MRTLVFVARRLGAAALVLAILSVVSFGLLSMAPGGPERALLGGRPSTPQVRAAIRHEYLLDRPFIHQYGHWLDNVLHGNFGTSVYSHEHVIAIIGDRASTTIWLTAYALAITLLVAVPTGLLAGVRRGSGLDQGITLSALVTYSMPPFALGLLLLYVFAVAAGWFPTFGGGDVDIAHLTLPALALAAGQAALVVRQTRAAALDVGGQDYMTFARARGLARRRIWGAYALRNASLPVLTVTGLLVVASVTGAIFVEQVFSLPGLGALLVDSVAKKDIPMVQALVLLEGAVVVITNMLVDLAYLIVDPRIRHGKAA